MTISKSLVSIVALTAALAVPYGVLAAEPALPTNPKVTDGKIEFQTTGPAMAITQKSEVAQVNWSSFSIGQGASVNVKQPNATSMLINRVTGSTSSQINGALKANGQVFLVNPNGIAVGSTGVVTASGFVASTLDMPSGYANKNGDLLFSSNSASPEPITVDGRITGLGRDGAVVLLGGSVKVGSLGLVSAPNLALVATKSAGVLRDPYLWVSTKAPKTPANGAKIEIDGKISATVTDANNNQAMLVLDAGTLADAAINVNGQVSVDRSAAINITVGNDENAANLLIGNDGNTGRSGEYFNFIDDKRPWDEVSILINGLGYNLASTKEALITLLKANQNILLNNDIDLKTSNISTGTTKIYTGKFNGLGHQISNAVIVSKDDSPSVGLFPTLTLSAYVGSLKLNNIAVSRKGNEDIPIDVGGLTGEILSKDVLIKSVYLQGSVNGLGADNLGGLVGLNYGQMVNSYTNITVSPTSIEHATKFPYSATDNYPARGGLVGVSRAGSRISKSGSIGTVTASISKTGTEIAVAGSTQAGGLVGVGDVDIDKSWSQVSILNGYWAGGLIGASNGSPSGSHDGASIRNSHASGSITGADFPGNLFLGGLAGVCFNCSISSSYATGAIKSPRAEDPAQASSIGGLVGDMADSTISSSYFNGVISADKGYRIGGLVGNVGDCSSACADAAIKFSSASGSITAGTLSRVGGLVGYLSSNARLTGDVSTMNVSAGIYSFVGGLVGWNFGTVSNAYSTGAVGGAGNKGALVGWQGNSGTLQNAVYLSSLNLPAVSGGSGVNNVSRIAGLSDAQLKDGKTAPYYLGYFFKYEAGKLPTLQVP